MVFFSWPLWARVFVGLGLGLVVGLFLHYGLGQERGEAIAADWIRPFGTIFIKSVKMLVVPLIFTTLVAGVIAMGDPKQLGSLGGRALGMYMGTTVFAVFYGLLMATIIRPGEGMVFEGAKASDVEAISSTIARQDQAGGFVDRLLDIIPENPVNALASGDVLQVIFFSIILGVGILLAQDKGASVARVFESAAEVMIRVTEFVMQLAPFGVFALMTYVMADQGLTILDNLLRLALTLYLACIAHIILTYGFIVKVWLGLPLIRFYRGMADAMAVAYSTSSSSATLPVTIKCAVANLGIKRPVAASVLPLGSTVNMDGTALYQGVIAVFAAQAFGIDLTLGQYVMVALAATLVSVGTAGIPSVSLFLAFITLDVIGVTGERAVTLIAFVFPFDRLLDMMRTVTNVTGDGAVATAVAKWQGELDEDEFRTPARL